MRAGLLCAPASFLHQGSLLAFYFPHDREHDLEVLPVVPTYGPLLTIESYVVIDYIL